jgi:hypothetical protein
LGLGTHSTYMLAHMSTHTDTHTHTHTHTHTSSPACSESLTCAGGATQKARLLGEGVKFSAAGKVSADFFWDPDSDDDIAED